MEHNRNNPFLAKIKTRYRLTHERSEKETLHIEVDIHGSGLTYGIGDSMGIFPKNIPQSVERLMQLYGWKGDEKVTQPMSIHILPLKELLTSHVSLTDSTKKFLEFLHGRLENPQEQEQLSKILANEAELKNFLEKYDYLDLAEMFRSAEFQPTEYVPFLKKLQPRLYSIASSPLVYPDEVHLTVKIIRFKVDGKPKAGLASSFLADQIHVGDRVPVFMAPSKFKLPVNSQADVIMIGPGTGVAPYRGFIQEHIALKRSGRLWLFFGEQRAAYDYLYGKEWEDHVKKGILTRLDLAFSRDQPFKIYVQHKMREKGQVLWEWIKNGAHVYVCGDVKHMAKDVEAELQAIIQTHGGHSLEDAKEFIKNMKKSCQYLKEVY